MIWFEQTGITTPFTLPQFPFVQTVGQQSQDNIKPAFILSNGPTVQVSPPIPTPVWDKASSEQPPATVRQLAAMEFHPGENHRRQLEPGGRLFGIEDTHLGVPDANINQLLTQDLSLGTALLAKVANPYLGQIPASSSLGGATITAQQLLRPYPRFTDCRAFPQ